MKALNCANCGANLNYTMNSPVTICQYCDSVNVLENVSIKIDTKNSIEGPPPFYEEIKPRVMLPQETFLANYGGVSLTNQGGVLWVSDSEIFFKPHKFNIGDLSTKFMKISEIIQMEKVTKLFGIVSELHITDKKGNLMNLVSHNRNSIISAIEKRKNNLV
jgi:hypothetical protein